MKKLFVFAGFWVFSCFLWLSASEVRATPYIFTIDGSELMNIPTPYSGDVTTQNPYPIGTRKMTVHEYGTNGDTVTGEYYSDTTTSHGDPFYNEVNNNDEWYLIEFNLWGLGGTDAQGWGETVTYTATGLSSPVNWSYETWLPPNPNVLHFHVNTNIYTDGIKFGGGSGLEFKFIADVSSPDLTIWFGGTLNNEGSSNYQTNYKWIKYQGNIQLHGQPVPEPATLYLLGISLLGLGFYRRSKSKI